MLGLSLSKILLTILILVAIWKGLTLVNRLASERRGRLKRAPRRGRARRAAKTRAQRPGTVELRPCPRRGALRGRGLPRPRAAAVRRAEKNANS